MNLTFDIYLRATRADVWHAVTDASTVPRWRFGMSFETDWTAGAPLRSRSPGGRGHVRESVPAQRLSYECIQTDEPQANGGRPSTVSFEISPMGAATRLHVDHAGLVPDGAFTRVVESGWPMILSSLKTLLETGEPLDFQ